MKKIINGALDDLRMPRVGKIKIGEKDEGRGFPRSLDYFVPSGPCSQMFTRAFGEKPSEIIVTVFSDVIEDSLSYGYKFYKKSGLYCFGDGDLAKRAIKDADGVVMKGIECMGEECEHFKSGDCNLLLGVNFLIPSVPAAGVWHFTSKGRDSRINIISALKMAHMMYGRIAGIPFVLSVEKKKSGLAGSHNVYPVVSMRPEVPQGMMQQIDSCKSAAGLYNMLSAPVDKPQLPEPEKQKAEIIEENEDQKPVNQGQIKAIESMSAKKGVDVIALSKELGFDFASITYDQAGLLIGELNKH
jgi:hypothetical protein